MKHYYLKQQESFTLRPVQPFHFDGTFCKPSHFPSRDRAFEKGMYWQSLRFGRRLLGIEMSDVGTVASPRIEVKVFGASPLGQGLNGLKKELEKRFDLRADISGFDALAERDQLLRPVQERWKGMRVSVHTSLYEFLVVATVLQNATVRRSVQMLDNMFNNYGSCVAFSDKKLAAFWLPASIIRKGESRLRELKVGYRSNMLLRQAQAFVGAEFREDDLRRMATRDLKARLLQLYGVGPASVGYLLFEVFKRYGVCDYLSPWELKIYSRLLFDEEVVKMERLLDEMEMRWGRWKMLAAHYLFEDLFWQRQRSKIPWLEELIRL